MSTLTSMLHRLIHYLTVGIWRIPSATLSGRKLFVLQQLRVVVLAVKGFHRDQCMLRASALTLYTLISVVPVVAMAFGIAKGFGFQERLRVMLLEKFVEQQEVVTRIVDYAENMLANTSGGLVAGVGAAILFFTVVKLFSNIEKSFNDVWGIPKGRSWFRRFTDYLSMMLILPMLLVVAAAATALVTSKVEAFMERVALLGPAAWLVLLALRLLPYMLMWLLLLILYVYMPNTKVHLRSGILAAIVAGTIYQLIQWAYFTFQVGVTKYSSIYGGFAALPLFIIWVQVSWVVVLLGAEIAFAHQNVATYEFEPDCLKASSATRQRVALAVMHHQVKDFVEGKKPETAEEIANALQTPFRLVSEMCFELTEAGLLVETRRPDPRQSGYLPARDVNTITVASVLEALDARGSDDIPLVDSQATRQLAHAYRDLIDAARHANGNVRLRDI